MGESYLAPGVYVEEVPSPVQPIAGVGTNTAAFIGIVPDELRYPIPNPDYDSTLAAAAADPKVDADQISRVQGEINSIKQEQDQITQRLADITRELNQTEPAPPEENRRRTLTNQQRTIGQRQEQLTRELNNANRLLQELQTPTTIPERFLRPYTLETFTVTVDPLDATLCTNFREYTDRFGSFSADDPNNPDQVFHRALTHAIYGFFHNGGTRCFVARINNPAELRPALEVFESIDEVAIVAAPGLSGQDVWTALVEHCGNCQDRFAILDCPATIETPDGVFEAERLAYGPADSAPSEFLPQPDRNAAYYVPYIEVVDPAKQLQDQDPARKVPLKYRGRVYVPPTGHVAGIYARTDEERGVHKAPANATVLGAVDVRYYISKQKQQRLNPQDVNCIRSLNGNITVWGARNIGGDKLGEWKYVSVRRFFLFLRESIDEGTQWVVFEPNDPALWGKIRRNVTAFLTSVWRAGALFGLTPEQAFYVKCDEQTNPPEERELGRVVTEIGVAIVRPAEFVIFRVTQATGPRAT